MPLESANTISGLKPQYPLGTEAIARGDDHLRLIKSVLQLQFPGASGNGFSETIISTEEELNHLSGVNDNIQNQIDALSSGSNAAQGRLDAPAGTRLLFHSRTVPLGWKIDTAVHDKFLRVVNDASGGNNYQSGGTKYSATHTHTGGGHTLTVNEIPSHDHISNAMTVRLTPPCSGCVRYLIATMCLMVFPGKST